MGGEGGGQGYEKRPTGGQTSTSRGASSVSFRHNFLVYLFISGKLVRYKVEFTLILL